jgi:hypothetical protein
MYKTGADAFFGSLLQRYNPSLRLTKESPFAFLLAAFLRLCEGGSEESELSLSLYLYLSWREIERRRRAAESHRR